ncbi:hypothetical protein PC116_g16879 [Phytophthora cactorum]|nr:hypothetical protein PC116_g16879 [Phytophthora cactorum]
MVEAVQPQQKYDDGEYNEEFAMACGYQDGQSSEPYGPCDRDLRGERSVTAERSPRTGGFRR